MNKRKILTIFLSAVNVLAAFFLWFSIKRAITVSDSSTWVVPMVWVSVFAISSCLSMVVFREMLFLELMLGISCLASLIFAPHLYQLVAVFLGAYFLFLGSRKIRRDMELNVKISVWKSLQAGKSWLLAGLVVIISMQYFLIVSQLGGQVGMPQFDLKPFVKKTVLPFMGAFNPSLKDINSDSLSVDEFFISQQSNPENGQQSISDEMLDAQLPENITPEQREMLRAQIRENITQSQGQINEKTKSLMLESFHSQLSEITGYPITGSEKISDVYAGLIAEKIDKLLQYPVNVGGQTTSAYPIILTVILILTIYPTGSILSILWFLLVKLLFYVLLRFRIVGVEKITVQKEMLV